MYEYKSELLSVGRRRADELTSNVDQCINHYTSNGWTIVFQSMAYNSDYCRHEVLLTFRKPKQP